MTPDIFDPPTVDAVKGKLISKFNRGYSRSLGRYTGVNPESFTHSIVVFSVAAEKLKLSLSARCIIQQPSCFITSHEDFKNEREYGKGFSENVWSVYSLPTCYKLTGESRVLSYASLYQDTTKVGTVADECNRACGLEGYTYSGRWNSECCFCGNELPTTTVDDMECKGKLQILVDNSIEPPVARNIAIELLANSTTLLGNQVGSVCISLLPRITTDRTYKIYFGDFIGRTEVISDVSLPLKVQYNRPGSNWMTLYQEDTSGTVICTADKIHSDRNITNEFMVKHILNAFFFLQLGAGGLGIMSIQQISSSDLTLECPKIVLQNFPVWCKATVDAGSHLYGTMRFGTQKQEPFSITADSGSWIRMSASRLNADSQPCPVEKFLVSGTSARYPGRLSEIDFYATATGSFKLILLRVKCSAGEYDYDSDSCSTSDGSIQCDYSRGNQRFLVATSSCVAQNLAGCETNLRRLRMDAPSGISSYDYEVIHVVTVPITATGWQVARLTQPWTLKPGDRLSAFFDAQSLVSCGPVIKYVPADWGATLGEAPTVGSTITSGSLSTKNTRLELGAWLEEPRELLVAGSLTTFGVTDVELTVEAYEGGLSSAKISTQVFVDVPLDIGGLEHSSFETNSPANLVLFPVEGRPIQFSWNFGDQSPEELTAFGETTHIYKTAGDYALTVNLSNPAGFRVRTFNVIIRDAFQFTGVQCSDAAVGQPTKLTLQLVASSECTCTWVINGERVHSGPEKTYTHTYTAAGVFSVEVTCTNLVISLTQKVQQVVNEAIQGLEIDSTSFPVGTNQPITFSFAAGSSLSVELKINGAIKRTTVNYELKQIRSEGLNIGRPEKMTYELAVTNPLGSENINGDVTFDIPLSGLSVTFDPLVAKINGDITFRVSFRTGTSIRLKIHWGDGNTDEPPVTELKPWPPSFSKTHRYTVAGIYEVRFEADAGLQQQTTSVTANVQGPLGNYQLSPADAFTGLNELFEVLLVNQGSGDAVLAQLTIDWGDGQAPYSDRFVERSPVGHIYAARGDYQLTATLKLDSESRVYDTKVKVRPAIKNFGCTFQTNPVKVGDTLEVKLALSNGIEVVINALFESGQSQNIKQPVAQPVTLSYVYQTAGVYPITVTAGNMVRNETCKLEADVRNPIENIQIVFRSLLEDYEGITNILIRYTGQREDFPTNLKYIVNWGDSEQSEQGSFPAPFTESTLTHKLASLNYFTAHITLENGVGKLEKSSRIGVFGRMNNVCVEVTVAVTGEPGYGPLSDRYAGGNALRLRILADNRSDNVVETFFKVTLKESGEEHILDWKPGNSQEMEFTQEGEVEIEGVGRNPFSQARSKKTIYIGTNLRGLRLQLLGQHVIHPDQEAVLMVSFDAVSSSTCICVQKNDTYGSLVYPAVGTTAADCVMCPLSTVNFSRPVNRTLLVPLRYSTLGEDVVMVRAKSLDQELLKVINIPVMQFQCEAPSIVLPDPNMASASTPLKVRSNEPTLITVRISGTGCSATSRNSIQWTVARLNPESLQRIAMVNISDQPGSTSSSLRIPRNRLLPGFYSASVQVLTQVAPDLPSVSTVRTVYIQSDFPPLLVQFLEGSPQTLVVGLDDEQICLNPGMHSLDPAMNDRKAPQGFTSWSWYCAEVGEKFTETTVNPKTKGYTFAGQRTGCFGDGPGRINTSAGSLCFWSGNFELNKRYNVKVIGFKEPSRSASATIQLEAKPGRIPIVQVTCAVSILCRNMPPQYTVRNSWAAAQTEDLYLKSSTQDDSGSLEEVYSWSLKYVYPDREGEFLSADELKKFTLVNSTPRVTVGVSSEPIICTTLPVTNTEVPFCVRASDAYGNQIESCFAKVKISPPSKEEVKQKIQSLMNPSNTELNQLGLSGNMTAKANTVSSYAEVLEAQRNLDKERAAVEKDYNQTLLKKPSRTVLACWRTLVNDSSQVIRVDTRLENAKPHLCPFAYTDSDFILGYNCT
ncbi:polycystin-1 [Clonorchis sinensis]|uniref:Polycystin-1 n=1 Tax=Clonorchis sinensis TaxID=79923 RepID=G7YF38_CLOSI|nr:polycystin-1 [Clonorchis sinensis]